MSKHKGPRLIALANKIRNNDGANVFGNSPLGCERMLQKRAEQMAKAAAARPQIRAWRSWEDKPNAKI